MPLTGCSRWESRERNCIATEPQANTTPLTVSTHGAFALSWSTSSRVLPSRSTGQAGQIVCRRGLPAVR
jgi:hypothetical protein